MDRRGKHKRQNTPEKFWQEKASYIVYQAMLHGILPKLSLENIACVDCGHRALNYDHRDYARPLEVEPVCPSCNIKRGPAKCPSKLTFKFREASNG